MCCQRVLFLLKKTTCFNHYRESPTSMKVGVVLGVVLALWRLLLLNAALDMLMQTLVACCIQLREGMGRRWWCGGVQTGVVLFSSWQQLSLSICLWISALTASIHHVLAFCVIHSGIWILLPGEVLIE